MAGAIPLVLLGEIDLPPYRDYTWSVSADGGNMYQKQEKLISETAWVFLHPDLERFKPILRSSSLAIALNIWEAIPEQGKTLGVLAEELRLHKKTVTAVTSAMEKAGVVNRIRKRETLVFRG